MTMFTRNDKPSDPNLGRKMQEARSTGGSTVRSSTAGEVQKTASSLISKSLKITGQLETSEDIQIEGVIEGDIRGLSVKVGSGATVKGTVYGEVVEISGTVNGKIEAKKVVLTGTARMSGDVVHQEIQIDSGAYLDGHCRPNFGNAGDNKVPPLHAVASAREKEAPKKSSNGSAKAEFGTL